MRIKLCHIHPEAAAAAAVYILMTEAECVHIALVGNEPLTPSPRAQLKNGETKMIQRRKKMLPAMLAAAALVIMTAGCNRIETTSPSEAVPSSTPEVSVVTSDDISASESVTESEPEANPDQGPDMNVTGQVKIGVLEYHYQKGTGDVESHYGIEKYKIYDSVKDWYYFDVDMDKDGENETFILVDTGGSLYGSGIVGDLWFFGKGFATQVDANKTDAYPREYDLIAQGYDYGNEIKVIQNFSPAAVNTDGYVLEYKDNMIQYPFLPAGGKGFDNGYVDIYFESYSMCSDGTGHCYVPHRYKFEADEWVPADFEEITLDKAKEICNIDIEALLKVNMPDITSLSFSKVRLEEDERIIASAEYKYDDSSEDVYYITIYVNKVYYTGFTSGSEWQFGYTPGQYDYN